MNDAWTDALAALRANMPADDEPQITAEPEPSIAAKVVLTLFYERKGRGGREATIIADEAQALTDEQLRQLAGDLRRALATGGSVRGSEILLQGDRRQALRKLLADKGYRVKG